MANPPLKILMVVGTLNPKSGLSVVVNRLAEDLKAEACAVDVLDFETEPLALYQPDVTHGLPEYAPLQARVDQADVIVLATPDYHGGVSGAIKNFLDHFWREFAGKLFVTIVGSNEKGLTVTDQLRTTARQCYAWTLPYGLSFGKEDVNEGRIISDAFKNRLQMLAHDVHVYGHLLAGQRRADLAGKKPGFMAKYRK